MSHIPSQYIRTELTPANIKQALLQLYEAESDDSPIAGKDGIARYLETDYSCDTNTREDLFRHFFTLDLSMDYIGRDADSIRVWTWKRIHGKDDGTKFEVSYDLTRSFIFTISDISYNPYTQTYKDEATVLENIQEILYNRAASASTFHEQCE